MVSYKYAALFVFNSDVSVVHDSAICDSGYELQIFASERNKQTVCHGTNKKRLVPFLFGLITLVPVMTYIAEIFFNGYTGTYIEQLGLFFTKETDLTGYHGGFTPAHLWFLLYLFVISLIALFIVWLQKKYFSKRKTDRLPQVSQFKTFIFNLFLLLMFLPEWLCLYILNIGGKSLGQFLFLFLSGYYIFSKESNLQKISQYRFVNLILCILSGSLYVYLYCVENLRGIWMDGLYVFYGWTGIMTLLGVGQSTLNFYNRISGYLSRASFPVYILHMPILVVTGFFVLKLSMGVAGQFLLIILISAIVTFLAYEIVKRVSFLRFLFGIEKSKRQLS